MGTERAQYGILVSNSTAGIRHVSDGWSRNNESYNSLDITKQKHEI